MNRRIEVEIISRNICANHKESLQKKYSFSVRKTINDKEVDLPATEGTFDLK
jgi:hypothetical protein